MSSEQTHKFFKEVPNMAGQPVREKPTQLATYDDIVYALDRLLKQKDVDLRSSVCKFYVHAPLLPRCILLTFCPRFPNDLDLDNYNFKDLVVD